MRNLGFRALVLCAAVASAAPALAQQQTVNFTIGGFVPRGESSRVTGDVLNENRTFLVFDINDFRSLSTGGEWLFPIGRFLEGGAGVSFTNANVATVYDCCVDNAGNEIEQELQLRRVPIDLTLRVVPFGASSPVGLYFGGGVSLISWRYRETGDFINFNVPSRPVFSDTFEASGTEAGPVLLGGVRFQGRNATAGFELRYHKVEASFDPEDDQFAGTKIDLGGWTYQGTIGFRF